MKEYNSHRVDADSHDRKHCSKGGKGKYFEDTIREEERDEKDCCLQFLFQAHRLSGQKVVCNGSFGDHHHRSSQLGHLPPIGKLAMASPDEDNVEGEKCL